jgi:Zn-dependent protease with chaperone function
MAYQLISPFLVSIIVSQWQEINADNFAIEHSSNEELLGGRRFFKAIKEAHLNAREIIPLGTIIISSTGENLKDLSHPSLASRAEKIESILAGRNVSFDTYQENNKITALVPFIR